MASVTHSQPQDEPDPDLDIQRDQDHLLEPPQTQTLETGDLPNPVTIELDRTTDVENHHEEEDPEGDLKVLDHGGNPSHHNLDPEDEIEQIGMSSSLDSLNVLPPNERNNPPLPSPANPPRRHNKRKKITSKKKQQAIERKLQDLDQNLNPIPFAPCKKLDFVKHEKLLKRLDLWEFVHVEFDRNIRVDFIAQLIAHYESRSRCSYVNENRINVSRADLARALKLKLPLKRDKSSSSETVDLDSEEMTEESKAFIEDLVSNWVLLHEDTWMTPDEVLVWTKLIRDGHPEKVDWASLIWFMVEKELTGEQLGECYYASHLQCLIKMQKPDLLLYEPEIPAETQDTVVEVAAEDVVEMAAEDVVEMAAEDVEEVKEEEDELQCCELKIGSSNHFQKQEEAHEAVVVKEPNIELTLGQEIVEKEEVEGEEDVKVSDPMEVEEDKVEEAEQKGNWLGDGKNMLGNHFMQPCRSRGDNKDMDIEEEMKPEEAEGVDNIEDEDDQDQDQEEEADDDDVFGMGSEGHNLETDVFTGHNLLQGDASDGMPFNLGGQFCDQSNIEFLPSRAEPVHSSRGGPSIFGNAGKREIDHDDDDDNVSQEALEGGNKRMRTDGSWGHNNASEFDICMEQVNLLMGKARMLYVAKERACQESTMNHEVLISELEHRAQLINHLNGEIEKKNAEIFRFERELYVMTNVLEDYREALKKTKKDFSEYRKLCQYPEEAIYKDAGPGGLVLTAVEVEKLRLKQEEDERLKWFVLQESAKDLDMEITGKFKGFLNQIGEIDKKLMDWKNEVALLKEEVSAKKSMVSVTEAAHQREVEKEDEKPVDMDNEDEVVGEVFPHEGESLDPAETEAAPLIEDETADTKMMMVTTTIEENLVELDEAKIEVDLSGKNEASAVVQEEVHLVVELQADDMNCS